MRSTEHDGVGPALGGRKRAAEFVVRLIHRPETGSWNVMTRVVDIARTSPRPRDISEPGRGTVGGAEAKVPRRAGPEPSLEGSGPA